jgi:hypothetical protein
LTVKGKRKYPEYCSRRKAKGRTGNNEKVCGGDKERSGNSQNTEAEKRKSVLNI